MTNRTPVIKTFLISLFAVGGLLAVLPAATVQAQTAASTADKCNQGFLTFPAWYRGLTNENCDIKSPAEAGGLSTFIWTIVLNLVEILLNVVGYAAVGFIIYGGIKYIYSTGSPSGMAGARKTILNAVIGLVLSILSIAVVNTIAGSLK